MTTAMNAGSSTHPKIFDLRYNISENMDRLLDKFHRFTSQLAATGSSICHQSIALIYASLEVHNYTFVFVVFSCIGHGYLVVQE